MLRELAALRDPLVAVDRNQAVVDLGIGQPEHAVIGGRAEADHAGRGGAGWVEAARRAAPADVGGVGRAGDVDGDALAGGQAVAQRGEERRRDSVRLWLPFDPVIGEVGRGCRGRWCRSSS